MEHNCPNHTETRELVAKIKSSVDSAHIRIDKIESDNKILHEMNTNIAVLAEQYKVQGGKIECIEVDIREMKGKPNSDVMELKKDVKDLKERPGKRWDLVVTVVITATVTGIISFIISKL